MALMTFLLVEADVRLDESTSHVEPRFEHIKLAKKNILRIIFGTCFDGWKCSQP